jgi:hypothetical protein
MGKLDFLLAARRHFELESHNPERITLRFDFGVLGDAPELGDDRGQALLKQLPGIEAFDVSVFRRRVSITYDRDVFPAAWWDILISGSDEQARALVGRLEESLVAA